MRGDSVKRTQTYYYNFGTYQTAFDHALDKRQIPDSVAASQRRSDAFFGHITLKEAIDRAYYGWEEGRKELQKCLFDMQIEEMCEGMQETLIHDVVGVTPDVGAYLRGEPECMLKLVQTPTSIIRKDVHIQANISAGAEIKGRDLFYRGACVAALIHMFETNGWSVDLTVSNAVWGSGDIRVITYLKLKEIGEPLNLDVIAQVLCHPAGLRRIFFALKEGIEEKGIRAAINVPGGYGAPTELELDNIDYYFSKRVAVENLEHAKSLAQAIAEKIKEKRYAEAELE